MAFSQTATKQFVVTGKVKKDLTFTLADLTHLPIQHIDSVVITNHLGEKKGTMKNLTVVPLTEVLKKLEVDCDNPKLLSEFYLVLEASDGYKVVYSWNEIFNSATGKNTFVVIKKEDVIATKLPESILLVTPTDLQTGRRHVKNLTRIVVKRAE